MLDNTASLYDDPNEILKDSNAATKVVLQNYWRSRDNLVWPKQDQWSEWYKAWRSVVEIEDDDLMTKLVIPLIFTDVEAFVSKFPGLRPIVEVWGRKEDQHRADLHRSLIMYDWDLLAMLMKLIEFVKSAEIYGTAWMKVVHRKKEEIRVVKEFPAPTNPIQEDIFGGLAGILGGEEGLGGLLGGEQEIPIPEILQDREPVFREKKVITWDDPWVDICEIDQVFPDPDGKDVDSCGYIIHRLPRVSLHDLKSARKGGKPMYNEEAIAQLEELSKAGNRMRIKQDRATLREMSREEFDRATIPSADPHKRQFTLLEQWSDSKVTVIVEEFPQVPPLRNEFNECGAKPFIRYTPIIDPNNIYGLSIPEVLFSMQLELSVLHSARLDNILYSVHQMYLILEQSGISSRQIRFRPGGAIYVKDLGDIAPFPRQPMDFAAYRESDEIRRQAQLAGSTDTFKGLRSDLTGSTATEAQLLSEASGSRAALMFTILGEQSLKPLGRQLIKLNELYTTTDKMIRVAGDEFTQPQFVTIRPEDLVSGSGIDLDVRMDISQALPETRQMRQQRAERAIGVLGQFYPPFHPVMKFFTADFLRAMGKNNPEELINSPEADQALQQALLAESGQGGQGGGSNAQSTAEQLAAELGAQVGG